MDIYEEQPDIHKEAVLREEVNVRKEVERDTVNGT
jgi:stress response protein YsnF